MDYLNALRDIGDDDPELIGKVEMSVDQRLEQRYVSLIRAAKLRLPEGQFVCVIRDVSRSGIGIKTFHPLPAIRSECELELQNGERHGLRFVRATANGASFTFAHDVEVERLIREEWQYPRRQLRLEIAIPVELVTLTNRFQATIGNLSQQGARIESDAALAINERLNIVSGDLDTIRATVRWRKDGQYGVVFEDTFNLSNFAVMTARLQHPALLATAYRPDADKR